MKTTLKDSSRSTRLRGLRPAARSILSTSRGFARLPVRPAGFSLLEMIGVMAVVAIIALAFALTTTKSLDRAFATQESAILQNLAYALQNSVLRNGSIPGTNNWVWTLATELGINPNMVQFTDRSNARAFVVDPAFTVNGNYCFSGYSQTTAGASAAPNYRVMILSSISAPLPGTITATAANFNNIWTTADGSIPTSSDFASYNGQGSDLTIQRINLSPLFVNLQLNNLSSTTNGMYQIQGGTPALVPAAGTNVYFLQNTFLSLVDPSSSPAVTNAELLLSRSFNFYYVANVWRSVPYVPAATVAAQSNPTASDLAAMFATAASMFGQSPGNVHALNGATPASVLSSMSNFLYQFDKYYPEATSYAATNGGNWPTTGTNYVNASNAQSAVTTAMANLAGTTPSQANPNFSSGGCQ